MPDAPAAGRPALIEVRRALRRRFFVVALCVVLVPAATVAMSLQQEKEYTATAALLFRDPNFGQTLFNSSVLPENTDPTREAATNVELVSQRIVARDTAEALQDGTTEQQIVDAISASAAGQSNVVSIRARDHSPQRAARIANTYARHFIALRRDADRHKISQGQRLVSRKYDGLSAAAKRGPRGEALQRQLDKLDTLASIQTGNAEIAQPADPPTSPSSPKPVRNGLLGFAGGILLAIVAALVLERLDRRIREPSELQETFGRPILSAIPQSRSIARSARDSRRLTSADIDAFQMLRANLQYFDIDSQIRSVLVTSPSSGDGKSTVAWNLAAAAASTGATVILIEADLRNPTIGRNMPELPRFGLSEMLSGHASLQDVLQRVAVAQNGNGSQPARAMDVIPAGQQPPNPVDLINSTRMSTLIGQAEAEYDLVVVDTPPTTVVSDAVPLTKHVSGVIVVSRLGATTRDSVARLRDQLENLRVPTLGIVVNGVRNADGYGYGYGD